MLIDEVFPLGLVEVEAALLGDVEPTQRGAGALTHHLPGHQVGVVLQHGDDDLVAGPEARTERVGRQVERFRGVLGEHDFLGLGSRDEVRDARPGTLEGRGGLGAERVHGTGHVGIVLRVVLGDRVDHRARLLRGVRTVQVDQRMPVDLAAQDREVPAHRLHIEIT